MSRRVIKTNINEDQTIDAWLSTYHKASKDSIYHLPINYVLVTINYNSNLNNFSEFEVFKPSMIYTSEYNRNTFLIPNEFVLPENFNLQSLLDVLSLKKSITNYRLKYNKILGKPDFYVLTYVKKYEEHKRITNNKIKNLKEENIELEKAKNTNNYDPDKIESNKTEIERLEFILEEFKNKYQQDTLDEEKSKMLNIIRNNIYSLLKILFKENREIKIGKQTKTYVYDYKIVDNLHGNSWNVNKDVFRNTDKHSGKYFTSIYVNLNILTGDNTLLNRSNLRCSIAKNELLDVVEKIIPGEKTLIKKLNIANEKEKQEKIKKFKNNNELKYWIGTVILNLNGSQIISDPVMLNNLYLLLNSNKQTYDMLTVTEQKQFENIIKKYNNTPFIQKYLSGSNIRNIFLKIKELFNKKENELLSKKKIKTKKVRFNMGGCKKTRKRFNYM
jgi:hypothetical protein